MAEMATVQITSENATMTPPGGRHSSCGRKGTVSSNAGSIRNPGSGKRATGIPIKIKKLTKGAVAIASVRDAHSFIIIFMRRFAAIRQRIIMSVLRILESLVHKYQEAIANTHPNRN